MIAVFNWRRSDISGIGAAFGSSARMRGTRLPEAHPAHISLSHRLRNEWIGWVASSATPHKGQSPDVIAISSTKGYTQGLVFPRRRIRSAWHSRKIRLHRSCDTIKGEFSARASGPVSETGTYTSQRTLLPLSRTASGGINIKRRLLFFPELCVYLPSAHRYIIFSPEPSALPRDAELQSPPRSAAPRREPFATPVSRARLCRRRE